MATAPHHTSPPDDPDADPSPDPAPLDDAVVAFVGAGVMAESMIAGLLKRGLVGPDRIVASHPRADRRKRLEDRFGIRAVEGNREAAAGADLVMLTVKPQVLGQVVK